MHSGSKKLLIFVGLFVLMMNAVSARFKISDYEAWEEMENTSYGLGFLLFFAFLLFIVGSILAIVLLVLVLIAVSIALILGLVTFSFLVGLYQKSISKGLKTIFLSIFSLAGAVLLSLSVRFISFFDLFSGMDFPIFVTLPIGAIAGGLMGYIFLKMLELLLVDHRSDGNKNRVR